MMMGVTVLIVVAATAVWVILGLGMTSETMTTATSMGRISSVVTVTVVPATTGGVSVSPVTLGATPTKGVTVVSVMSNIPLVCAIIRVGLIAYCVTVGAADR